MAGPFPSANSVTRHAPTRGLFDAGDWPETPTAIAEPTSKVINTSRSVAHRVACLIEVSLSQSNRHDRRAGLHGPPGAASSRPYVTYLRRSATFAIPAFAQASSPSCDDPELPTPPTVSLPANRNTSTQRQHIGDVALRFARGVA